MSGSSAPESRRRPAAPIAPGASEDYDALLTACPACGAAQLAPYDSDFRGHCIDRCGSCGIKLMNPQYSDAYLAKFYGGYISVDNQGGDEFRKRPEIRRTGKQRSLALLLSTLTTSDRGGAPRILMVGCGDGIELEVARDMGWQPEGYDVDPATTVEVAAKRGVPVHTGEYERLARPDGYFDAVFMDQVIEHLKDPKPYLQTSWRLLRPGGVLFVGLPNIGSISNRLKTITSRYKLRRSKRGKHYASKHHIFYYTPSVLTRVLALHGFETFLLRGSLKPQCGRWATMLGSDFWRRWFPVVDSGFIGLARRQA